ncbi:heterokaryon incompatibility protein-domain-containing protein [Diaporthe sp. PMI_573]|nr:heterokaryon incompatibility protein-domain-containing protein [Diaporthaceae sp. PMI_573]
MTSLMGSVTSLSGGDRRESKLYQPIIDKYEIRVLEIKPGKLSDQLKGALHHCSVEFDIELNVNLKGPGQRHALWMKDLTVPILYTALSYTWGEPKFDAKFECDGYVKMITKSLESALRHFRQVDRAVVMWVDQICIDQGNNEEKAQQVPLMSQIYENAINTAIWLGDADDDSDTALRLLEHARICLQFFTEKQFDPNEVARMGLPEPDAGDWEALWKLLSRRWFERLWIIQEVALSKDLWVVCGNSAIKWESLAAACISLADTGISQWLTDKYSTSVVASDGGDDVCKKAYYLETIRLRLRGQMQKPELLTLMVDSRRAQSMDARDKVYGMLGICDPRTRTGVRVDYSDKYHVAQLYQDVSEYHITEDIPHNRITLDRVLSSVDHDSVDLPSWVADWRRPRRTMALGSSVYSYQADGRYTPRSPTAENKTLQMMLDFVVNLKDYPSRNTDFTAFWKTLVAGKDERRSLTCPDSFAEIFSYILDETTGEKYSISGQAYTPRQKLPKGRGGLHEDKLRSRKPRSAGVTFQQVRTAMINATKNRRLGATVNGYIVLILTYMADSSRVSIAGLNESNVAHVAAAIDKVVRA